MSGAHIVVNYDDIIPKPKTIKEYYVGVASGAFTEMDPPPAPPMETIRIDVCKDWNANLVNDREEYTAFLDISDAIAKCEAAMPASKGNICIMYAIIDRSTYVFGNIAKDGLEKDGWTIQLVDNYLELISDSDPNHIVTVDAWFEVTRPVQPGTTEEYYLAHIADIPILEKTHAETVIQDERQVELTHDLNDPNRKTSDYIDIEEPDSNTIVFVNNNPIPEYSPGSEPVGGWNYCYSVIRDRGSLPHQSSYVGIKVYRYKNTFTTEVINFKTQRTVVTIIPPVPKTPIEYYYAYQAELLPEQDLWNTTPKTKKEYYLGVISGAISTSRPAPGQVVYFPKPPKEIDQPKTVEEYYLAHIAGIDVVEKTQQETVIQDEQIVALEYESKRNCGSSTIIDIDQLSENDIVFVNNTPTPEIIWNDQTVAVYAETEEPITEGYGYEVEEIGGIYIYHFGVTENETVNFKTQRTVETIIRPEPKTPIEYYYAYQAELLPEQQE